MVNGNAPPPCANATRSFGNRSNTPPKIMEQIAERRFCRHGDQPRQPVFRHTLAAQHVPRMNKDRGIEFFSGAPDRLKRGVVEVQSIYASEMRIRINVRSDLRAPQPELPDAAFQFALRRGQGPASEWFQDQ